MGLLGHIPTGEKEGQGFSFEAFHFVAGDLNSPSAKAVPGAVGQLSVKKKGRHDELCRHLKNQGERTQRAQSIPYLTQLFLSSVPSVPSLPLFSVFFLG
ncbi:MAG: hypothetical protein QNK37_19070, partial [Acidobacteriota bacterium]|nr:hypothetical protein [Acidobacteriota bacterium]